MPSDEPQWAFSSSFGPAASPMQAGLLAPPGAKLEQYDYVQEKLVVTAFSARDAVLAAWAKSYRLLVFLETLPRQDRI